MVFSVNFSSLRSDNSHLNSDSADREDAAEFVMTQDAEGNILSFYWQNASRAVSDGERFTPVAIVPYLQRIQRVLDDQTPEQFFCLSRCHTEMRLFELLMSPILLPGSKASMVIVTGRQLVHNLDDPISDDFSLLVEVPPRSDRYQKLLTQIAWNIRRTLDLPTIWQQTVDGLGKALGVSRCIICPFEAPSSEIEVVAEYRQESLAS